MSRALKRLWTELRWAADIIGLGFILRLAGAVLCFAIAIPLMFLPGPAFLFWLAGILLLGFGVRDVVRWVRRVGVISEAHAEWIIEHPWVKWIDKFAQRELRWRERRTPRDPERPDGGSD